MRLILVFHLFPLCLRVYVSVCLELTMRLFTIFSRILERSIVAHYHLFFFRVSLSLSLWSDFLFDTTH